MDKCKEVENYPAFSDGRKFCPATLPQSTDIASMANYEVKCTCNNNPSGCTIPISVFTDAVEAVRDVFWGRGCKADSITISVKKV